MHADYVAVPAETEPVAERLTAGTTAVLTELREGDRKATRLLTFVGATLAGVCALTRTEVSPVALVLSHLAAVPTAAAVVVVLWALCPCRAEGGQAGVDRWARFHGYPAALVDDLDRAERHELEDHAHHLAVLSRLAQTQYHRIALAIHLLLTGLGLTALALLTA